MFEVARPARIPHSVRDKRAMLAQPPEGVPKRGTRRGACEKPGRSEALAESTLIRPSGRGNAVKGASCLDLNALELGLEKRGQVTVMNSGKRLPQVFPQSVPASYSQEHARN